MIAPLLRGGGMGGVVAGLPAGRQRCVSQNFGQHTPPPLSRGESHRPPL
jgi:hypothetical protein